MPAGFTLEELFAAGRAAEFPEQRRILQLAQFLPEGRQILKLWERHGSRSLRTRAIRRAEQWMLARTRYSDGLGAIYPSMMYVIMALDLLGYPEDHPDVAGSRRASS